MAFEKSVLSIVAYGCCLTCVTSIAFTIHARHAHGLFVMKCITMCSDMEYLTFQTQIHLQTQYIFDTNITQSEYAFLFPFSILCYVDILLRYVDMLFYYVVTYLIS